MAVILVGEVVSTADSITGYLAGNISTDDDFVQGTGSVGNKISATLGELVTSSLGATAPYSFASGGPEFGWHIIMWFNTKTPVDPVNGLRIAAGDGTSRGHWNVVPRGFYKGGFITAVVNTARPFDIIFAGSYTLGGNPAQLTNVTQIGGVFNCITSIMGNFNNVQVDQMTIGLGLRVDGGTVGVPNTFQTVRAADEDVNKWGWWSSVGGSVVGKGKLFIGPATGTATSVFNDTAFKVEFANERVAVGFYEIAIRGANTTVSWSLASISAASAADARWGLTVDSTTLSFTDTNGVWAGAGVIVLNANTILNGTTIINSQSMALNGATLTNVTVLNAATATGVPFITTNNLSLISGSTFEGSTGHAILITAPGTYSFSGNRFTGYGIAGSTNAAIYNNSGGLVTINVSGGGNTPTIRNGAGASTVINNTVSLRLTGLIAGSEVRIFRTSDNIELAGVETSGTTFQYDYNYTVDTPVRVVVHSVTFQYFEVAVTLTAENSSIPIQQRNDRNFLNP